MIDAYITELGRALRGPRRVKADLLTEARDSLVDAADAYQSKGLAREQAERQAVAEFGDVRQIAPAYQATLGLAQARRTALLVLCARTPEFVGSEYVWRSSAYDWTWQPGPGYLLLTRIVDWMAIGGIACALLAVLACGIGVRYLGVRRWLSRAIGVGALAGCASGVVAGLLLVGLNPDAMVMIRSGPALLWTVTTALTSLWILVSARRCLTAA